MVANRRSADLVRIDDAERQYRLSPTLTGKLIDHTIHDLIRVSKEETDVGARKISLHPRFEGLEPRRVDLGKEVPVERRRAAKSTGRSPRHDAIRTPDAAPTGRGEQIDVGQALPLTPHRCGEELRIDLDEPVLGLRPIADLGQN